LSSIGGRSGNFIQGEIKDMQKHGRGFAVKKKRVSVHGMEFLDVIVIEEGGMEIGLSNS
jgi:hypothetical protein